MHLFHCIFSSIIFIKMLLNSQTIQVYEFTKYLEPESISFPCACFVIFRIFPVFPQNYKVCIVFYIIQNSILRENSLGGKISFVYRKISLKTLIELRLEWMLLLLYLLLFSFWYTCILLFTFFGYFIKFRLIPNLSVMGTVQYFYNEQYSTLKFVISLFSFCS